MISTLISVLVVLLVLFIIWYVVKLAGDQFGVPPVIIQIVGLILALIFLLFILNAVGVAVPGVWRAH